MSTDFWLETCIIFLMSDEITPLNVGYTWWASMDQVLGSVESILQKCMIKGETGWPPHSGGIIRRYGGERSLPH